MPQSPAAESAIFVFVTPENAAEPAEPAETAKTARTVAYALREARNTATDRGERLDVRFVVVSPSPTADSDAVARIRDTVATVTRALGSDVPSNAGELRTSVAVCRTPEHGGSTDAVLQYVERQNAEGQNAERQNAERGDIGGRYAGRRDVRRLIVPGDAGFSVERLRARYGEPAVVAVPPVRPTRRRRLLHPGGLGRLASLFALSYVFYLALGGFTGGLDVLTGALSAAVVAFALARVSFTKTPTLRRTVPRLARFVVFLPVLLWEVVKANLAIAYLLLHPRLPIDPSVLTLETGTRDDLERMVLANSITVTPGSVAIDQTGTALTVHALTRSSRDALERGRLQRLVSWVFHGASRDRSGERRGRGGERRDRSADP